MRSFAVLLKTLLKKDYQPYISLSTYRYGLIVTFLLFVFFGLIDLMIITSQQVLTDTLMVRFLFIIPIYIIFFLWTFHPSFKPHQPLLSFILGIATLSGLITMLYLAKRGGQNYYDLYFTAFILALSFAPLVLWYNKIFMVLSLVVVLFIFNISSIYATPDLDITYTILQNILILTGGILGSYCRHFVINILRWNIYKTGVISQRRQMLELAHKELEDADNSKRLLLSILSHDIKGPLNNIQTLLQFLSQDIITAKDFSSHSKNLNEQLTHTKSILDNVLLWSKSEMNIIPDNEMARLRVIVAENITGAEAAAADKNIIFRNNVPPTLVYEGDLHVVRLVLRNLLTNAVKFTENGDITISSKQEADTITLSVKDDGVGMDEYEAEQLFNAQKQFSREGTRAEKGTGLGLTICREVVKKYGGKISVETEKGRGTTFHFTLPPVHDKSGYNTRENEERELKLKRLENAVT